MRRPALALVVTASVCGALGGPGSAQAAGGHEHGVLRVDVAVEGTQLAIALDAPLDSLLGYERAPRTEAERKAASDVLARLREPQAAAALFTPDAAAQCRLEQASVEAPVLEPGPTPARPGEHAGLEAQYSFRCAQPAALRALELGLFEAFRRTVRIEVQVVAPQLQRKVTLKRPDRRVPLTR